MDLEVMKKLIRKYSAGHTEAISRTLKCEQYYRGDNDIIFRGEKDPEGVEPVRKADNRIASSFYQLLVDQKASYAFTVPPTFDVGHEAGNKKVAAVLGDKFPKVCARLCIDAANSAAGWIHYWKDKNNKFCYTVIDPKQIIPIWDTSVDTELLAVLRVYQKLDDDGSSSTIYEYHTPEKVYFFRKAGDDWETLSPFQMVPSYNMDSGMADLVSEIVNPFGRVPFIPFFNSISKQNDLHRVKKYIDAYDKVYSGYLNDLEDVQEIIFILSGYEGEDLKEFLDNLKKYKTINLESDETGKGGLSTLTIDIPVEAREKMLERTRKSIFEQGMGIDPDPQNFGNSSGVALGYLYSLLELKTGMMEMQFREGFAELVQVVCDYLGITVTGQITQTWTRKKVQSDVELCDIARNSVGVLSNRTILSHHPWVENAEKEQAQIDAELQEAEAREDEYTGNAPEEQAEGVANEETNE